MINFKKYGIHIMAALSGIFIILTIALALWSSLSTPWMSKFTKANPDYFNGWINQDGFALDHEKFFVRALFTSWGGAISFVSLETLWEFTLIICMIFFCLPMVLSGITKDNGLKPKLAYVVIGLMGFFSIIYFSQLLLYFKSSIYEDLLRLQIFELFEKNFLIKNIGQEELNHQIKETAQIIKDYYGSKFDPLVIVSIIILLALNITGGVWIAVNVILKSKFPNLDEIIYKARLDKMAAKAEAKAKARSKRRGIIFVRIPKGELPNEEE